MDSKSSVTPSASTSAAPPPAYSEVGSAVVAKPLIQPVISHTVIDRQDVALVTLQTLESESTRPPVDVVCVIDLSGSMDASATLTANASKESTGLTVLDIVKHAVKTVITALGPNDRVALVSFHDNAATELPLTNMTKDNQANALKIVEKMQTLGSTNIWGGLDEALDAFGETGSLQSHLQTIFLFTDGQPNIRPPAGEVAMLEKRKKNKFGGRLPCCINTFGFGTNLDSELLCSLANIGEGAFAFIPDASFVGTVFVDALANILSSVAKNITVTVEAAGDAELWVYNGSSLLGGHAIHNATPTPPEDSSFGFGPIKGPVTFSFASMIAAQSKDVILHLSSLPKSPNTPFLKVVVEHMPTRTLAFTKPFKSDPIFVTAREVNASEVLIQHARLFTVDRIAQARKLALAGDYDGAKAAAEQSVQLLKSLTTGNSKGVDERVSSLLKDIEGQVMQAISKQYINSWGTHYLLSLCGAHRLQQCNNFKDPGVQVYTGPLFASIRDDINELFLKIPAPKPSGTYGGAAQNAVPVRMARYHNSNNPCFAGFNLVYLASGEAIPISKLQKGQVIRTSASNPSSHARVTCILETRIPDSAETPLLVKLPFGPNGLTLSPYHPISLKLGGPPNAKWMFPLNVPGSTDVQGKECRILYSVLAEDIYSGHFVSTILIEGVECATLAHGLEGDVIGHLYLGTSRVVSDMKELPGFAAGRVYCAGVRRNESNLICGLVSYDEMILQAHL